MAKIKLLKGNTPVLFMKSKWGKLVEVDLNEELKAAADARLGFGDESEEFKKWLAENPLENLRIYQHQPDLYPDGIVLEDVHVHEIYRTMDGGWGADISWASERPYSEEEE